MIYLFNNAIFLISYRRRQADQAQTLAGLSSAPDGRRRLEHIASAVAERMRDPAHEFIVAVGRRGIDAAGDILNLARLIHAPVVTLLDAKGAVPETDPQVRITILLLLLLLIY